MDENKARSLLEQAAGAPAPSSSVDIAKARRIGRRRLRLRRFGAPAASVSAVAIVIGLIASGAVPLGAGSHVGGRPAPVASGGAAHTRALNPLVPYATFGWLPVGYAVSAEPMHGYSIITPTVEQLTASDSSGRSISFEVFPIGQCHLTGPRTGAISHLSVLSCGGLPTPVGLRERVTGTIPGVAGGRAYWWTIKAGQYHSLALRTAKAWVVIDPAVVSLATEIRVATHVRFGSGRPLAFPFRLTGLPSRWRVGLSYPWTVGDRLMGSGLWLGPGSSHNQVQVSTAPANTRGFCGKDSGQERSGWQRVTVGGLRGILLTVYGAGHFQTLCFEDAGGLAVSVTVNRPFSGQPLAAARNNGGVIDIFLHHLHLLGPDPAHWTTHPIPG